ncbi:hypothetical protein ATN84_12600 [Paramesorhizobium deserti]|uniref:Uncharacterized protein n=1 Tax=Paramesorhizobium deserti TaxID=1494590 RepID=A0A135HUH4_9HYPH|nr:DUF4169 family protein [Paramesorhizobium deserti]KXF76847.1 hypothetical protein ATN84_12600 [Paramesorhizobium deserti]
MSDIVNLRQFKKRKARDEKEKAAAENRIRHGRTGAEKKFEREQARKTGEFLDRNRLDPATPHPGKAGDEDA